MDYRAVKRHERRSCLHAVAHRDVHLKSLTLKLHRIHADVDEHLCAVVHAQTYRMTAVLHDHRHLGIRRCNDDTFRRLDGNAVAHHLLREHLILDLAHIDDMSRRDRVDRDGFLRADRRLCRIRCGGGEQCLKTLADLRHRESDNDLECVTVAHQTVCACIRKGNRRGNALGVADRDAQTRCTVRHVDDVRRAAESFEECLCLYIALIELHARRGGTIRGITRLFCLVVRLRKELVIHRIIRASRRLVVLVDDDPAEYKEVDGGEAQSDDDLRNVLHVVIREERDPVLHECVDQAAAEVPRESEGVEGCRQRCREQRVDQIEQRSDKEEGELQRLRDAAEHRRNRRGDEERRRLFLLLGLGTDIDRESRTRQAKHLAAAVEGKAALGEEVAQTLRTRHEVIDMSEPVGLNAAVHNRGAVHEGQIDEVMQTGGQEDFLRERVCPDANDAAGLEEKLKVLDGVLNGRPDKAENECHRDHHDEADRDDEGRSFEDAEPVGDVRVIEVVVQERRAAGDKDRTEHAHVQRLDVGDHRESRAGPCCLTVVHTEHIRMESEETSDEVVEQHIDDERLHRTACRLLLCEADRHGNGEEDRHLCEDRPRTLFDHVPEIVPYRTLRGDTAEQPRVFTYDGHRHRETEEREQYDGRIHRAAEPLHVLHDDILAECHVLSPP